jgi:hypothetical protein
VDDSQRCVAVDWADAERHAARRRRLLVVPPLFHHASINQPPLARSTGCDAAHARELAVASSPDAALVLAVARVAYHRHALVVGAADEPRRAVRADITDEKGRCSVAYGTSARGHGAARAAYLAAEVLDRTLKTPGAPPCHCHAPFLFAQSYIFEYLIK